MQKQGDTSRKLVKYIIIIIIIVVVVIIVVCLFYGLLTDLKRVCVCVFFSASSVFVENYLFALNNAGLCLPFSVDTIKF